MHVIVIENCQLEKIKMEKKMKEGEMKEGEMKGMKEAEKNVDGMGKKMKETRRKTMKMGKKVKDIGLGIKPPENTCNSDTCPWHGHLKVRGRIFNGRVASDKGMMTSRVSWNYYKYIKKYERMQRCKTTISAHNPECISAKSGDIVDIAECRTLSKTKSFVIVKKV